MYMHDPRHPKKYPDGEGLPVTPEWKRGVRAKLEANKRAGLQPGTVAALARMINGDKGGVTKMLKSNKREKTKYARPINELLRLDEAMIANPLVTDDELDQIITRIRKLPDERRTMVMDSLRSWARLID
jgi:hypothetical protein